MNRQGYSSAFTYSLFGVLLALQAGGLLWLIQRRFQLDVTAPLLWLSVIFLSTLICLFHYRRVRKRLAILINKNSQVEAALNTNSARLTSFIENPEYIGIYSLDTNYCYTGFNSLHQRSMKEIFGGEVNIGVSILDLWPDKIAVSVKRHYDRALNGEHFTVTTLHENRYYTQFFNPVFNELKEVIGLTSNIFEVTDSIKAEQELESYKDDLEELVNERTSELETQASFYQQIIDGIPNSVFVRNSNHQYILVNRSMAEGLGMTKSELLGKTVKDTHYDHDQAILFEEEDKRIMETGEILEEENKYDFPDGSQRWLFLSKRRILIDNESMILGVHHDITNLKETGIKLLKANEELQSILNRLKSTQMRLVESEKMASLGQLTAGLAHEINNPINYVSGNLEPMRRDLDELRELFRSVDDAHLVKESEILFDEIYGLLDSVKEGASRVKTLMSDLTSFSSPQGTKTLCDINDCINSTVNLIQFQLKGKIDLSMDLGELPGRMCNIQQLNQVFLNILNNAVQSIEGSGHIYIQTKKLNDAIVAKISDSGIGIPEENISKIFDPFFTTKDVGEGTGLGLSISYRIIQEHGGSIEVESKEGAGSTFSVILPIDQVTD